MNKSHKIRYILSLIIISIFSYFGYFLFITIKYQHHNSHSSFERYLWILNDSIKKDVDSVFYVGLERESDNLYEYIIDSPKGKHFITICHLKNIDTIDFDAISFNQDISLDNLKMYPAEKYNLESVVRPEITIKSKLPFNNCLRVNLNHSSRIVKTLNSKNFKGFFGDINKMSIANYSGKNLILFDYGSRRQQTLFLFYKEYGGVFFILINSEKPINESIINILSFKNKLARE